MKIVSSIIDPKEYKSYKEMCEYLKASKKVGDVTNEYIPIKKRTYVSVINPYKKIFASGEDHLGRHVYLKEIDISEFAKFVLVDDMFCLKYQSIIGNFERKLKLEIANELCSWMYSNKDKACTSYIEHLKKSLKWAKWRSNISLPFNMININLVYSKKGFQKDCNVVERRQELLTKIIRIGSGKEKARNSLLNHYQNKHEIVPFWLLVHVLTLGELSIIFGMLSTVMRNRITASIENRITGDNESRVFANYIDKISKIRNIINHYEPIFPHFYSYENKVELSLIFSFLDNYDEEIVAFTPPDIDLSIYENAYNKKVVKSMREFINYIK